jgi:hypothetical protein
MPPAAAPSLTRRALASLAVIGALLLGGAGAAWAQDPTATTVPPTSGVLVPGGPTTATTAPTATSTSQAPADDTAGDEGGLLDLDANEKVWVIVGALVAIAVLMMILTVLYWRHTRPGIKQDRRITREEKRAAKRERKAAKKDPFVAAEDDEDDDDEDLDDVGADDDAPPAHPTGPLDLDAILGAPDASRSVFGEADEDPDPDR